MFFNGRIMRLQTRNCHLTLTVSKYHSSKHVILDLILSNKGHWLEVKE